jgi:AraC-like DNA-binding protein
MATLVHPPRPQAAPLAQWEVRAAPMRGLPALLQELGVPPAPLLRACSLPADAFADPDAWVSYSDVTHLLGRAAQRSGRNDLGLLLAERCDASTLGPLLRPMLLAPTVGAALQVLRRDFHLHDRGAVPYLLGLGRNSVALGYVLQRHDAPGTDVVYDLAMGIGLALLRGLCGPGFVLQQVQLPHAAPPDPRPYRRHFGAPVVFDAAHARLEFAAPWLVQPIAGAQEAVRAHLRRAARADDAGAARSTGQRARSLAHTLLMTGGLSEPRIAAELGLQVRTLRRRLAAEGLQVQALMHDVRDQFAQQLLADTRLPLADIAHATQYAEAASFARAFRRRVGVSPGRWRAAQRQARAAAGTPP